MAGKITNEYLAELLDAKITGVKAEIKAASDITGYKLNELKEDLNKLIDYQKVQNNRTTKLEDETKIFRLVHRNPKTSLILFVLILAGILVLFPFVMKAIF